MIGRFVLLILLMQSSVAGAQIRDRETTDWQTLARLRFGGITRSEMLYVSHGEDSSYLLLIRDMSENQKDHFFSIAFKSTDNTFEKLYQLLKDFFSDEHRKDRRYTRTFDLGNTTVVVQQHRLITGRAVRFSTREGFTHWTAQDIDKLFGKE